MKLALGNSNKNETRIKWIELCLIMISCFFIVIFIALYLLPLSPCSASISCYRAFLRSYVLKHLFAWGPITPSVGLHCHTSGGSQGEGFVPINLQGEPRSRVLLLLFSKQGTEQAAALQPCTHQPMCCNLISPGWILASLLSLNSR